MDGHRQKLMSPLLLPGVECGTVTARSDRPWDVGQNPKDDLTCLKLRELLRSFTFRHGFSI